jgi:hypothetical protein
MSATSAQADLGSLCFGEMQSGQRLGEPGDVGEGQLDVEQALLELLSRRSVSP